MPGIWDVSNGYNTNTRKISSKLTFEAGESFSGRVVSKGDGKDVTIRLSDGWQFIAELDGNVNAEDLKLVKFQVDGFENGKLKLKVVQGNSIDTTSVEDDNFQEIIEKEGLSKDDIEILKRMVKHDIPLTKSNINEIKGLIQFNEKINSNNDEIDAFIDKYIQSKGIDGNTVEGQSIKETLSKFFNTFKGMSPEDMITFIENKLEFTEENINSFNKLFKGDESIEKLLIKISNSLNNSDISNEIMEKNNFDTIKDKLNSKEAEVNKLPTENNNTALASKLYDANNPTSKKVNVLDVLKTLAENNENESDGIKENKINISNEKGKIIESLMEKLDDKELVKLIKDVVKDNGESNNATKGQASKLIELTNKNKLEEIVAKVEGKEVKFTEDEFIKVKDALNNKINDNDKIQVKSLPFKDISTKTGIEELIKNGFESNKEDVKNQIKSRIEDVRNIVKGILNQTELKEAGYEKVMGLIKENINDVKVFNSVNNEYYYLNFPIKSQNTEYPCQLIIKDNRKDGKKLDTTNAKMVVSVKTINLGEVDGYLTMREKRIDINLKCDKKFTSILNDNKVKLVNGLGTIGLFVNVNVSEKEKPADIVNCRDFFNDLTISAIDRMV